MTRAILCAACAKKHPGLHPEDAAAGYNRRMTFGKSRKPSDLHITLRIGDATKRIEVPEMLCDYCNCALPDGSDIAAVTMWQGAAPSRWEAEYLAEVATGKRVVMVEKKEECGMCHGNKTNAITGTPCYRCGGLGYEVKKVEEEQ